MDIDYYIGKKRVSWNTMTIEEYIKGYTPNGWEDVFEAAEDDIFPEISTKLVQYNKKNTIYPPLPFVFNALDSLMPQKVKVVIIGQDPYFNPGEATGLSFSVPDSVKAPPSLRNIYKELDAEGYTGYKNRKSGDLSAWLAKGVFLYNTCLTVNKGTPESHGDIWGDFSDIVINYLKQHEYIAWILLGRKAQQYVKKLDREIHGVYTAGHPSPANRSGGFIGSGVFEEAEEYLHEHNRNFSWHL